MEVAGSTEDVNILVQFDRIEEYDVTNGDWTETRRYRIEKDDDKETITSPMLEDLGEVNMGDPEELIKFVKWGAENYPADHYAVVLWNHGGAFYGVCFDDTSNNGDGDALTMPELRYAFSELHESMGENIDLVGFDACLMAEVAVLYQLRDITDFVIASGYNEPGDGWPYEKFLPDLVKNPDMSPVELGKYIADTYVDSYTDLEGDPDDSTMITMTLFEMSKISKAVERLNEFAMVLSTSARIHNAQIWAARDITESYDMLNAGPFDFTGYSMYDIIDFIENLRTMTPLDSDLRSSGSEAREALYEFIKYARVDPFHTNSHGLTIYFPNTNSEIVNLPGRNEYDARFDEVDFASDKYWDDFLFHYYQKEDASDTPPTVLISTPLNNETISADKGTILIEGTAFDAQSKPTVELRIDENDWLSPDEGSQSPSGCVFWNHQWDISDLSGRHTIDVRVSDSNGNVDELNYQVEIDNQKESTGSIVEAYPYLLASAILLIILAVLGIVVTRMRQLRRR
jgi:clostripain